MNSFVNVDAHSQTRTDFRGCMALHMLFLFSETEDIYIFCSVLCCTKSGNTLLDHYCYPY